MEITIKFKGVDLDIEYDYQPEEQSSRNYPGCHEKIDICEIKHMGVCFLGVFEADEDEIIDTIRKELYG